MTVPQREANSGRSANQAPSPIAPNAAPAAPQGALSAYAAPPAPMDYMALYQQGLQQAKGSIAQRLQGDLGYIQQQQQAAGQAIDQLPGGINAAYDQANQSNQNAENVITAAQQKSGVGSLTPLGSYMAPVNAALHGTQTSLLQNVPLLRVGAEQQANEQRALAMQGASQDQSALQAQQQQFYMQQAAAQQAAKAQQDSQNSGAMQNYAYQKLLQDDKNKSYAPNSATLTGTQPVTDSKGIPLGYTPNQVSAAKKSDSYTRSAAALTGAKSPQEQAQIWHEMSALYAKQPAMLAALASIFPGGTPPPDPGAVKPGDDSYFGIDLSGTPLGKYAYHPGSKYAYHPGR